MIAAKAALRLRKLVLAECNAAIAIDRHPIECVPKTSPALRREQVREGPLSIEEVPRVKPKKKKPAGSYRRAFVEPGNRNDLGQ